MVPPPEQRRALGALLETLKPEVLAVSERILGLIPPRPAGYDKTREHFQSRTEMTFDPLSVAEVSANLTIGLILHPARAARLVEYHARDKNFPGLEEVIGRLISGTWYTSRGRGYQAEINRVVDGSVLSHLFSLALNQQASNQVRAIALFKIRELKAWLTREMKRTGDDAQQAHFAFANSLIRTFEESPKDLKIAVQVEPPAGPPIGEFDCAEE
jgi:hypothetical protein